MALSTTIGGTTAESYATLAQAASYHAKRGRTAWDAADSEAQEWALRNATTYLDSRYTWRGARVASTQALALAGRAAQLAGGATALATAVGALTAEIRLSGAAVAQALAAADLTTVPLTVYDLAIDATSHSQSADNLILGSLVGAIIASTQHSTSSTNLTLSSGLTLSNANALHSHITDNIDLSTSIVIVIADAIQAIISDNPQLTLSADLVVNSAIQAIKSSNLDLYSQLATLEQLRNAVFVKLAEFGLIDQQYGLQMPDDSVALYGNIQIRTIDQVSAQVKSLA